jgi:hypothetical protein
LINFLYTLNPARSVCGGVPQVKVASLFPDAAKKLVGIFGGVVSAKGIVEVVDPGLILP